MAWKSRADGFSSSQKREILSRDRVCALCGLTKATEADHIVSVVESRIQGLNPNALDNGQGLCVECHKAKTNRESAAGRRRTLAKLRHPGAR